MRGYRTIRLGYPQAERWPSLPDYDSDLQMLPPGFKANLQLVRDPAGIAELSAKLSLAPVIGVDTEFIREAKAA